MRMLRLKEVIHTTGLSRSSIYRMIDDGVFPKSVPLCGRSGRSVAWLDSEINDWLSACIELRDSQKSVVGG